MLALVNRISKTEDFDRVREEGELFQSTSFAISVLDKGDKKEPRFGFIVSTKISKKATLRNRAKRAIREAVRHEISYVKKGMDVVFLAKMEVLGKTTDEISREVKALLREARLI